MAKFYAVFSTNKKVFNATTRQQEKKQVDVLLTSDFTERIEAKHDLLIQGRSANMSLKYFGAFK